MPKVEQLDWSKLKPNTPSRQYSRIIVRPKPKPRNLKPKPKPKLIDKSIVNYYHASQSHLRSIAREDF